MLLIPLHLIAYYYSWGLVLVDLYINFSSINLSIFLLVGFEAFIFSSQLFSGCYSDGNFSTQFGFILGLKESDYSILFLFSILRYIRKEFNILFAY